MNPSNEQLYMLDMPMHLASWHKWAHEVYNYAKQYEHFLFTEADIHKFHDDIEAYASMLRNFTHISAVDMDKIRYVRGGYEGYQRPNFMVGNEFSISFVMIRGRF